MLTQKLKPCECGADGKLNIITRSYGFLDFNIGCVYCLKRTKTYSRVESAEEEWNEMR